VPSDGPILPPRGPRRKRDRGLANRLFADELHADTGPEARRDAVNRLLEHVLKHFADEERELEAAGYEGLAKHKDLHAALVARAARLAEASENDPEQFGAWIAFVAGDVVSRHLMTADRAFFPIFQKVMSDAP